MSMFNQKFCEECGAEFFIAVLQDKYCSMSCKRKANNRTYYSKHKQSVISSVLARRKNGMKKAAKKIANVILPESMSFDVDDDIGDVEIDFD